MAAMTTEEFVQAMETLSDSEQLAVAVRICARRPGVRQRVIEWLQAQDEEVADDGDSHHSGNQLPDEGAADEEVAEDGDSGEEVDVTAAAIVAEAQEDVPLAVRDQTIVAKRDVNQAIVAVLAVLGVGPVATLKLESLERAH